MKICLKDEERNVQTCQWDYQVQSGFSVFMTSDVEAMNPFFDTLTVYNRPRPKETFKVKVQVYKHMPTGMPLPIGREGDQLRIVFETKKESVLKCCSKNFPQKISLGLCICHTKDFLNG